MTADQLNATNTDPQYLEETAALHLAEAWKAAGLVVPHKYPIPQAAVITFMEALGYAVDDRYIDLLCGLGRCGGHQPKVIRQWTALNIHWLRIELEVRRRWRLHPNHLLKMSAAELRKLEDPNGQRDACFRDLRQFDHDQLLLLMERAETMELRRYLRLAIQSKYSRRTPAQK